MAKLGEETLLPAGVDSARNQGQGVLSVGINKEQDSRKDLPVPNAAASILDCGGDPWSGTWG